jgi:lipopolysaccharide/colanic/teichoic acid biosynthesis glycosyltransferase
MQRNEEIAKRLFDLFVSLFCIVLLSPLFLVLIILIKIDSPGPAFYFQTRIGRNFKPFTLYKFRTMHVGADISGPLLTKEGDQRVTGLGSILRRYKIDELAQLLNILKGDMSFVGPRPELEKFVLLYRDDYEDILDIKPGLTDYAALEFKNEGRILMYSEDPEIAYIEDVLPRKIMLYHEYKRTRSFFVDCRIMVLTLREIACSSNDTVD